jgi:membrane associated rhomboid family serine protease
MTHDSETVLRETDDPKLAEEWLLVLIAEGFSPEVRRTLAGLAVSVPKQQSKRAFASLFEYDRENSLNVEQPQLRPNPPAFQLGLVVSTVLVIFHLLTLGPFRDVPWVERGSADATKMVQGELWTAVTALTLHADLAHALGNALAAALLFPALSSVLGGGVSLLVVLVTGAVGNLATAYFHTSPHVSIGASTAIFSAIGLLGGIATIRNRQATDRRRRGAFTPVVAAVALLCLLGTTGERIDVLAHLLGFISGVLSGILIAGVVFRPPALSVQIFCGSATAALVVVCWFAALA